jgi:proteasome lid subunit RPN8/RPN11
VNLEGGIREEAVSGFSRTVRLARHGRDAVEAHAREAAPAECCGLLLGRDRDIVDAVRARNIAADPSTRFLIEPEDHFAARRAARERGLGVVGFYHSHPRSTPEPSARDRAEFSYPNHLYLIISLCVEPVAIGLFRFDEGNFQRISFVTVA